MKKMIALLIFFGLVQIVSAITIKLIPNGDVYTNQLTAINCSSSTHWNCVDEYIVNTTDYLYSNESNKSETFTFTDLPDRGTYTIHDVELRYYARGLSGTNLTLTPIIRTSTNITYGSPIALSMYYTEVYQKFYTNPLNGQNWTKSSVDALVAGAKTGGFSNGIFMIAQIYAIVNYTLS
jgi:hypothetical protein